MHYLPVVIAAALAGAVSAAPQPQYGYAWVECPAGTYYSACYKTGFYGCCSVDACQLDWCPDDNAPIRPDGDGSASNVAAPPKSKTNPPKNNAPPPAKQSSKPSSPKTCQSFVTSNYNVFPDQPQESTANSTFLWVSQDSNGRNRRDQVMVFSGVPATAKNCQLRWTVPDKERIFAFAHNGLMEVYPLKLDNKKFKDVLGEKKITWDSVKGLKPEKNSGTADTTNWPQVEPARLHLVGALPTCGTEIAVLLSLKGEQGAVIIGQKEGHGFFVEYDC